MLATIYTLHLMKIIVHVWYGPDQARPSVCRMPMPRPGSEFTLQVKPDVSVNIAFFFHQPTEISIYSFICLDNVVACLRYSKSSKHIFDLVSHKDNPYGGHLPYFLWRGIHDGMQTLSALLSLYAGTIFKWSTWKPFSLGYTNGVGAFIIQPVRQI